MGRMSGTAPALPYDSVGGRRDKGVVWPAMVVAAGCLAACVGLVTMGVVLPGLAFGLIGLAVAIVWGAPGRPLRAKAGARAPLAARVVQDDPDIYLDLDAVQVHAVYQLGAELYAHLRGGVGKRVDPATGARRPIETSDVSLTWRCSGRRTADRLAHQLNRWQAQGTLLRLLALRGRSALLIEDTDVWVSLPELRLAA